MRVTTLLLLLAVAMPLLSAAVELGVEDVMDGSLNAEFFPAEAHPTEKLSSAHVEARVSPLEPMTLFVAEREGAKWRVMREIGQVNGTSQISFGVDISYEGNSRELRHYLLLGKAGGGRYYGNSFDISVDWADYEKTVREAVTNANVIFVPMLGAAMAVIILAIFEFAYVKRRKGEYNAESLFFPALGKRPMGEVVADIFINPVFMLFELACAGLFAMVMLGYGIEIYGGDTGVKLFLLSGAGALAVPFAYMALAWLADVYDRGPLRFMAAAFIWGMFAAVASFIVNSMLARVLGIYVGNDAVYAGSAAILATALVAPATEEFMKAFGLLIMAGHHEFKDMTDGIVYGFAIGVGFSFIENWFYFMARANPFDMGAQGWVAFITYRLLFNALAHGALTAACGAFIGYFKSRESLRRYAHLAFIPGVFIAISLHAMFNISAILDEVAISSVSVPVFVFNPVMVGVLGVVMGMLFILATLDTRRRVREGKGLLSQEAGQA